MTRLKGIDNLSAREQMTAYSELATQFGEMAAIAKSGHTKLMFTDMAVHMKDRAEAVSVFDP
jgi:hypothetical protein